MCGREAALTNLSAHEEWRGNVVARSIITFWAISSICGLIFLATTARMLSHVTGAMRQSDTERRQTYSVPEVGNLILVLRQLGIYERPVPVWHVTDPTCDGHDRLCTSLRTLAAHGAVHLLSLADVEQCASSGHNVVSVVDLDEIALRELQLPNNVEPAFFSFGVAWSVKHTYAQLCQLDLVGPCCVNWAHLVGHTLVAKPSAEPSAKPAAEQMVESVLCRILQLALSPSAAAAPQDGSTYRGDQGPVGEGWMLKRIGDMKRATKLSSGGNFEVHASSLAPSDASTRVPRRSYQLLEWMKNTACGTESSTSSGWMKNAADHAEELVE